MLQTSFYSCPAHIPLLSWNTQATLCICGSQHMGKFQRCRISRQQPWSPASLHLAKFCANTLAIYISSVTSALSLPLCAASDLKMTHRPQECALLSVCPFLQFLNYLWGCTPISLRGLSSIHSLDLSFSLISVQGSFYCLFPVKSSLVSHLWTVF